MNFIINTKIIGEKKLGTLIWTSIKEESSLVKVKVVSESFLLLYFFKSNSLYSIICSAYKLYSWAKIKKKKKIHFFLIKL